MKDTFFKVSMFFVLALNSNLASVFGWENQTLFVSCFPLVLFIIREVLKDKVKIHKSNAIELFIIFLGLVVLIIKGMEMFKPVFMFFILPYFLSIYLSGINLQRKRSLQHVLFLILAIEVILSIYERSTLTILLESEDEYALTNIDGDDWSFRASGLYGHPLINAMIITILTGFIIYSEIKIKYKISILLSVIISLFCFNERGNILLMLVMSIPFIYMVLRKLEPIKRLFVFLSLIIALVYAYNILSTSDFGGRLFNHELSSSDSSTMARFKAFDAFEKVDLDYLLWGFGNDDVYVSDILWIENGYIMILLKYGVIIGIPLLFSLLFYIIRKIKDYSNYYGWIVAFAFLILGFTNPHLSSHIQWIFFICGYYAFRPQIITK